MDPLHVILVALVQGVTEFLPVSSSGHLILLPRLLGVQDQGQLIDVAVHVGTLGAVILFFRREVALCASGLPDLLRGRRDTVGARLLLGLTVATIPVVLLGLVLSLTGLDLAMRSVAVIGWSTIIFGVLLYWADRLGAETRHAEGWTLRDAAIMGLWQAVALIPGTSRSGITITAARFLGYERRDAARLSMLMSIPTIAASGILVGAEALGTADSAALGRAGFAAAVAFAAALVALALMMRLLRSVSYTPYVIYRMVLGAILLGIVYL